MNTAAYWIDKLELEKHPEGGYYKEVYRSELSIDASIINQSGERSVCTSIYFLLASDEFSAFHRIKSDEIWHFYSGSSLTIHMIDQQGGYEKALLGLDHLPQFVVPANVWFGATVNKANSYALVGCTVSPGFDFLDFELANKENLSNQFPEHKEVINKLSL